MAKKEKWLATLSTTEPYNHIGLIQVRQNNKNSETWYIPITQNGEPFDMTDDGITEVFFCTKFLGKYPVEQRATIVDAKKGHIKYTMSQPDMQIPGIQQAYFKFVDKNGNYQGSTQSFSYKIIPSIESTCSDGGSYIVRLEELFKLYMDFYNKQKQDATDYHVDQIAIWEKFFNDYREIIESVDPGGIVLKEIVEAKYPFDTLAEKLHDLDKSKQDFLENIRNADTPLVIPTYDNGGEAVHPKVVYFKNKWNGFNYWMAYTPYPKTNDKFENPCIVVSNDGIQWLNLEALTNPIDVPTDQQLADNYHMSDTHLLFNYSTNKLECWYRLNKNGVIEQILRKTSSDGKKWSAREVMYETDGSYMVLSPAIILEESKYKMWFINPSTGKGICYVESPTGKLGTWSTEKYLKLNYVNDIEKQSTPWHLDVEKFKGKYYLALNARNSKTRILQVGESETGLEFNNIKTILEPRPKELITAFDTTEIYRSSYVVTDNSIRLYYSCYGNSGWKIAVLAGTNPYDVNKFNSQRELFGDMVNLENIILNLGKKLYTQENKGSYVTNDHLKFLISKVAGASMKLNNDGSLSILKDNGVSLGKLNLGDLDSFNGQVTNLKTNSIKGVTQDFVVFDGLKIQNKESPLIQITHTGVNEVFLGLGQEQFSMKICRTDGKASILEVGGVLVKPFNALAVEGMIRFNPDLKKHQGYDGSKWNDLY